MENLSTTQIDALESIFQQFSNIDGIEKACRQYRKELREFHSDIWKLNLASIERVNKQAFEKVLITIPTDKIQELTEFIEQNKHGPIPEFTKYETLSQAKASKP